LAFAAPEVKDDCNKQGEGAASFGTAGILDKSAGKKIIR
jgi:hypothetical protein